MTVHDHRWLTSGFPTATLTVLKKRARILRAIRNFFDDQGYFEVETPLLSHDIVVDAWLEPFVANWLPLATEWNRPGTSLFLQTSPEFAMKRLMAAGAEAIYQLGKVFRNGEVGHRHNPEFTMLEWYRRGDNLQDLMTTTERLVQQVIRTAADLCDSTASTDGALLTNRVLNPLGFERLAYRNAFLQRTGHCPLSSSLEQIRQIATEHRLVPPPGLHPDDRDGWLNFLLAELIEPHLGKDRPTFLLEYPISQAALARPSNDGSTAQRFELYIDGIELCNGYDELTDPAILRDRIREQAALRQAAGLRPLPAESRLLSVMERGLPACGGNALGVDRLVMIALGLGSVSDVIAFPFEIA